jgi:two-component system LytT family response regulator
LATAIKRLSARHHELEKKDVALEYDDHLFLPFGNGWRFLKVSAILCIRAAGAYSEILTSDGEKALCLKSLNQWVARLPGRQFVRIHRSTIVNVEYIERVDKWFNYSYQVRLCGVKEPLTMSRRCAARLKDKLK